jgi:hypothetical protein
MRGNTFEQVAMLSTLTPDQLVPKEHPIRRIKVSNLPGAVQQAHGDDLTARP